MTGIYIQIQQIAIAVEEFVRRPSVNIKVMLDGSLQLCGQVVMKYVRTAHIIFLDDVLPRLSLIHI